MQHLKKCFFLPKIFTYTFMFVCLFFHFFSWVLSQNSFIAKLIFFFFLATPHSMWDPGSPTRALNPRCLQWKHRGPTPGLPGRSSCNSFTYVPSLLNLPLISLHTPPLCAAILKLLSITFEHYYRVCTYFSPFQLSALFLWASFMW